MNLFEILNDAKNVKKIENNIDRKLNSKEFWKNDEKNYKKLINKIEKEHLNIRMSEEKANRRFCY